MPFLRRHGRQIQLIHGERHGERIRHRILHRFRNTADLAQVLEGPAWEALQQQLQARYPDISFDWPRLAGAARDLVATSPACPEKEPQEARIRGFRATLRTAETQLVELMRERDPHLVLAVGHDLRKFVHHGFLVLNDLLGAADEERRARRNSVYQILYPGEVTDALVDEARAAFEAGCRKKAKERFAEARALEPLDADVLTSEANCYLEIGQAHVAEPLYREALSIARHQIPLNRRVLSWGELDVRPYSRAAYGLALALEKRGEDREAIRIWLELMALCPDDGVGARFCLGPAYHRLGDLEAAIDWYARYPELPEQRYNLALARHGKGELEAALTILLEAFTENPYIPPLLLGKETRQADVYHLSNTDGLEWAQDYVRRDQSLWTQAALRFLSHAWNHPEVQEALHEIKAVRRTLKDAPVGSSGRTAAVHDLFDRKHALLPREAVRRILREIEEA